MVPSPITSHPSESPQFPACPQHLRQVQLCQCLTHKEQSLYYDLESESGRAMCLPHLETPEVEFTNFLMQLTNQIYFLQNFTNLTYFQKGASSYFNSNHNDQDMALLLFLSRLLSFQNFLLLSYHICFMRYTINTIVFLNSSLHS